MHSSNHIFGKLISILGAAAEPYLLQQIDYLKTENRILRRRIKHHIHTTPFERIALLNAGMPLGSKVRELIAIVKYKTYLEWKRYGYQLKKRRTTKRSRPRIKDQIRKLIVKLAEENNWGFTKILGEIRKLHIFPVSRTSIRNILKEYFVLPAPYRQNDNWHDFIKRHAETLWACDFFTKSVWTLFGPKTFYILFYLNIKTRTVHIAGIIDRPNQKWVLNATWSSGFIQNNFNQSKRLLHDKDTKFSRRFDNELRHANVIIHKLPSKSPNLNAYAESWYTAPR